MSPPECFVKGLYTDVKSVTLILKVAKKKVFIGYQVVVKR